MIFKILLISIILLTFIKTNCGMNHTRKTDDQALIFWSDVDKINEEISGESSTDEMANVRDEKAREQWAQDIFLQQYQYVRKCKSWKDLRNESYVQLWPILCYQLWDKHPNMKRGQECSATRFNYLLMPKMSYRVVNRNNNKRYRVDLLQCKCPKNSSLPRIAQRVSYSGLYFFVTPCAAFNDSYYIMRKSQPSTLEVFDVRNTNFSPKHDYNHRAPVYQTNVQTYGQPGRTGIQNEIIDEEKIQKWAQKSFMHEYQGCTDKEMIWHDLRNESYSESWCALCLLLWDVEPDKKTEQKCNSTLFSKFYNQFMSHRVVDPNSKIKIYADLLFCDCPSSVPFYVTKSYTINNTYYIMRMNPGLNSEVEVYEMRSVVFSPISII